MALAGWNPNNILRLTIDSSKIDDALTNFPVLVTLSSGTGQNTFDATVIFDEFVIVVDDDFTGTNGDPPNTDLWSVSNIASLNPTIQSNKLYWSDSGAADQQGITTSNFKLSGDFDVQVDWDNISRTAPSSSTTYLARFRIYTADANEAISNAVTSDQHIYQVNGTDEITTYFNTTDYSGKFRFKRVGTTITAYYWSGSQWEWDGNVAGYTFAVVMSGDIQIQLAVTADFDGATETTFDNFTVNSGAIIWPSGHPYRKKIAITDSNDNQLYVEIERWDWVNELANLWVKVPTIVSGTDTNLYFYYDATVSGNTTYIGDTGDAAAQNVWDDNFVGVWHMAQDPSTGGACVLDSTSYTNHGTPAGTMLTEDLVDGKAGKALDFDGGDDNINIGTPTSLNFRTGHFTLDFVIKPDSIGSNQRIIDKQSNTAPYVGIYYAQINAAGTIKFFVRDVSYSTGVVESISTLVSGTYYQVSCVYDSTGSKVYIDNALNNSNLTTVGDIDNRNQDFVIGEYFYDGIWQFGGIIEEVRVSNTDRPAEWAKATYYSNWNDLISFSVSGGAVFGQIVVGGQWKSVSSVKVSVDGVWKDVSEIQIVKDGVWKSLTS